MYYDTVLIFDKLCKLLIDCLKSPFSTKSCKSFRFRLTFSFSHISVSLLNWTSLGMGLNLNLMHLDAKGSIILSTIVVFLLSDVVTNYAKSGIRTIILDDSSKSTLSVIR